MKSIILLVALLTVVNFEKILSQQENITQNGPPYAYLNLNNISTVFRNNGISDIDVNQQNAGFVFPKGSGKTAVFMSGLLWGAILNRPNEDDPHVGGSVYDSGLQGGKIISPGVPEDPSLPHIRIYRVRPDVYPGGPYVDLSVEALDEGKTEMEIRTQYELDWTEWRASDGAPYTDIDANGFYNPNVDIPGIPGAVQTIWFVANDLESANTLTLYGTMPMGIEYQATYWEYKDSIGFDNLFFRKYKLINKSFNTFDSMYISMWSDTDIGNAGNDFAGCDTLLNLGFGYNADGTDPGYDPLPPPAIGFDLIRGPLVPGNLGEDKNRNGIEDIYDFGSNDNNQKVLGFINLPMTAYYYFTLQDPLLSDPPQGTLEGASQFYNFMQGKIGSTGEYFINPVTGLQTRFALSGDPVTGLGWIDGMLQSSGDRRFGLSTGPLQMAPGDTQVVIIAEIAAGAVTGINNIDAIALAKYYSQLAQEFYDTMFPVNVDDNNYENILKTYILEQNYPNPFNPTTKIIYSVPQTSKVIIKVFDVLGNEIETLINEEKPAGTYELTWYAEALPSGVYFYQLKTGNFIETKKMILLK